MLTFLRLTGNSLFNLPELRYLSHYPITFASVPLDRVVAWLLRSDTWGSWDTSLLWWVSDLSFLGSCHWSVSFLNFIWCWICLVLFISGTGAGAAGFVAGGEDRVSSETDFSRTPRFWHKVRSRRRSWDFEEECSVSLWYKHGLVWFIQSSRCVI